MIDYLTHYYRDDKPPFQSMSYLPDDEAERIGAALLEENPAAFRRFRKFPTYWPRRRRTDQWVRSEFEKKGGCPVEPYPQYLVLGTSSYIATLGDDGRYAEIRIPLSEFDPEEVSFTYSDCMVSLYVSENDRDTPHFITWRVKKVITEAFKLKAVAAGDILPEGEDEEVIRLGHEYISSLGDTPRAPRMRRTFELYMSGLNIDEVITRTGQTKPAASHHLNEIEDAIELAFIRGKIRLEKKDAAQKERAEGKGGRRASVRDFHSFRVTWITLALAAGVPLELVQRVTGHKTVEIVLKHYFRPGREDFKKRIMDAMPSLLSGQEGGGDEQPDAGKIIDVVAESSQSYVVGQGPSENLEEALALLEGVTGKANQKRVAEAVERIQKAKAWYDSNVVREASQ